MPQVRRVQIALSSPLPARLLAILLAILCALLRPSSDWEEHVHHAFDGQQRGEMVPLSTSNAALTPRCLSVSCPSGRLSGSTRALRPYSEAVVSAMVSGSCASPFFPHSRRRLNDVSHYFIDTLICNRILYSNETCREGSPSEELINQPTSSGMHYFPR